MSYDFYGKSEYDFENRMVAPEYTPEDAEVENPLRPKRLTEYIGQDKSKRKSLYLLRLRVLERNLLTMYCFTDRRVWVKPHLPVLLQMK